MNRRLTFLILIMFFVGALGFSADNDGHDVTLTVSEIFEVVLNPATTNFSMSISSATPGVQPTNATDNTDYDLHYTSVIDAGTHKITVGGSGDFAPDGTTLYVSATTRDGGSGLATLGTGQSRVVIATDSAFTGGDIVTGIVSGYSGTATTEGALLTYEFEVTTFADLVVDAGKTITVTYTMVDV